MPGVRGPQTLREPSGGIISLMKITRTVYYCTYTRNNDKPPHYSGPFPAEQEARDEAKILSGAGYWGAIEKHRQFKQDYENDYAWHVDWEGAADQAIELVDYF